MLAIVSARARRVLLAALVPLLLSAPLRAQGSENQIHFSITLSGHVLLGVGFTHWVNQSNTLSATAFLPLELPEKSLAIEDFPFGFRAGYAYYGKGDPWRMKLGADMTVILSPPDPGERRVMPLITFSPGVQYTFESKNMVTPQLWLSYFPMKRLVAPTGIEVLYGRGF
jgi:hypothetical protein